MNRNIIITLLASSLFAVPVTYASSVEEVRTFAPQPGLKYKEAINDLVLVPPAQEPDAIRFISRGHYYKQAITSTKPRITSSEEFVTLPGSATKVVIPAGKNALVNLAYTAESRCSEPGSSAPDWCEVRILVDGVEASPQASRFGPDTYAFDSTDSGTESENSWESHAMDRHHCIFNSKSDTARTVPVEVQWKVTNFDAGNAPSFWLDDWSFTIQLAEGCHQRNLEVE